MKLTHRRIRKRTSRVKRRKVVRKTKNIKKSFRKRSKSRRKRKRGGTDQELNQALENLNKEITTAEEEKKKKTTENELVQIDSTKTWGDKNNSQAHQRWAEEGLDNLLKTREGVLDNEYKELYKNLIPTKVFNMDEYIEWHKNGRKVQVKWNVNAGPQSSWFSFSAPIATELNRVFWDDAEIEEKGLDVDSKPQYKVKWSDDRAKMKPDGNDQEDSSFWVKNNDMRWPKQDNREERNARKMYKKKEAAATKAFYSSGVPAHAWDRGR